MRKRNSEKGTKNKHFNENTNNEESVTTASNDTNSEQSIEDNESNSEAEAKNSDGTEWKEKYEDMNDRYLRLYSEFDNFRRRTAKEKMELVLNANEDVLKDLLSTLDDFERAIQSNENSDDTDTIKGGFILIYNKFLNILEGKGLKSMESKGDVFNIDFHEAITNVAVDEEQKGKVVEVIERGYFLNDKVLRYAKVIVGQ